MGSRHWWDQLDSTGPAYGYFSIPSKTCLIVKPAYYDAAVSIFGNSGVLITAEGKHHLGAAIMSRCTTFHRDHPLTALFGPKPKFLS